MTTEAMLQWLLIGAGATAATDIWALARKHLVGVALPNYRLVGRWVGHLTHGRFRHDAIAAAPAMRGEAFIGWVTHYAVGMGFALLLPASAGSGWLRQPTLMPALLLGIGTVLAPFLVMQPAMGAGFFASRTPRPGAARLQSLMNHAVFGLGLFITAKLLSTGG
jgi:hypothetical protein